MFACEVDRPFAGPELLEKRPVVGGGVGDSDQRQVGPHFPDVGDLGSELRRRLASFRHPRKSIQAIAVRVLTVPQDASRQHASLSPSGGTMTPSSETVQQAASSGTVSRMSVTLSFSFQRLPAFVNRRLR